MKRIFILLCISFTGYSQVIKFDRAYEVGAAYGTEFMVFDELNEDDWNKLTPLYESYKFIDTSFKQDQIYSNFSRGSGSLFFSFALKKPTENETPFMTPMLRISLNTSSGFNSDVSYTQQRDYIYDSLMLFSTGEVLYLDSTVNTAFRKSYYSSATNLMTNLLFHGNRTKRWSFYLGFGLGFGLGSNARSRVVMTQSSSKEYAYDDESFSEDDESNTLLENNYRSKNYFIYHFNVPIGVDFRIKNNDKFYGRSVLSLEAQFGANWMRIPEVTNTQNTSFKFVFAYKYRF